MKMDATGKSRGEWIFPDGLDRTYAYLSDQQKILGVNPFCHKVEPTELENVYRWHFRVTDPQNNPFDVVFHVEQVDELLVELPEELHGTDPETLTEEQIREHTVGRKIIWQHHPSGDVEDPQNYLFEGKAFAEMVVEQLQPKQTKVNFDLKIDVRFILYPAFRIIPEKIIRAMTNAGMSMIMQTATNRMFQSITKDFGPLRQA